MNRMVASREAVHPPAHSWTVLDRGWADGLLGELHGVSMVYLTRPVERWVT